MGEGDGFPSGGKKEKNRKKKVRPASLTGPASMCRPIPCRKLGNTTLGCWTRWRGERGKRKKKKDKT